MKPIAYFQDLEVGDGVRVSSVVLPQRLFRDFITLTQEAYPIHIDPQFARNTAMGECVPPGTLLHLWLHGPLQKAWGPWADAQESWAHYDYLVPVPAESALDATESITSMTTAADHAGTVEVLRRVWFNGVVASVGRRRIRVGMRL